MDTSWRQPLVRPTNTRFQDVNYECANIQAIWIKLGKNKETNFTHINVHLNKHFSP